MKLQIEKSVIKGKGFNSIHSPYSMPAILAGQSDDDSTVGAAGIYQDCSVPGVKYFFCP